MIFLKIFDPSQVHCYEKGIKTSVKVYQETILEDVVKDLPLMLYQEQSRIFQEDCVPIHKTKITQVWLDC